MTKHLLKILLVIAIITGAIYFGGGLEKIFNPTTVRAFGNLLVDFHVPVGTPIFNLENMKPGDSIDRPIDVTNNASDVSDVRIKGIRDSGVGGTPLIESVLTLTINDGATTVYGPKTLDDFFTDSATTDGVPLSIVNPSGHKTYDFVVSFPSSAENEFQAKSVALDLTFGEYEPPIIISDQSSHTFSTSGVTITWTTNRPTTSRVVYDTLPHSGVNTSDPNYGYAFSTETFDTSPKVISHTVTINGLSAGTAYYYRVISTGSPAVVSGEGLFRTFSSAGAPNSSGGAGGVLGTSTTGNPLNGHGYAGAGTGNNNVLGTETSATSTPEATFGPMSQTENAGLIKWILTHKKISLGVILLLIAIFFFLFRRKKSQS